MARREKLLQMISDDANDPFLHYALGIDYAGTGELDAAVAALETALQRDPRYVAAYFHLGKVRVERGEPELAREILVRGQGVARDVGDAHAAEEMAGLLASLGG